MITTNKATAILSKKLFKTTGPSIPELIGAGMHVGRTRRDWVSVSERYLSGYRHGVSVLDLSQTSFFLRRASSFVEQATMNYARGFFYGFAGTGDRKIINFLANLGQVTSRTRWNGGFVTNTRQFKKRVKNYLLIPTFVVCFKLETRNYSVLREKYRLKLPLVCPIDTNSNPSYAEYPIPANSAGRSAVGFFGHQFAKATFSGIVKRIKRVVLKMKTKKAQYFIKSSAKAIWDKEKRTYSREAASKFTLHELRSNSSKTANTLVRPTGDIVDVFEQYYYKPNKNPSQASVYANNRSRNNKRAYSNNSQNFVKKPGQFYNVKY